MRFDIVAARFEDVDIDPDKLALIASDRDLTWVILRAEVLAMTERMVGLNMPKGAPVAIRGHKEAGMVVAMLACMTLDHPYIPLDIMIPEERVQRILTISGAQLIIDYSGDLLSHSCPTLLGDGSVLREGPSPENVIPYRSEDPLRYIIFTSGSTGEPKGVCIPRAAAQAFLQWTCSDFGFSAQDVFVNQAPFSFDLSVYELFTSLHSGGTLLLNDAATAKDSLLFLKRLKRYGGTVWISTPTFAYLYLTEPRFNGNDVPSLHTFLFCGEALPKMTAKRLLDRFPESRVLNSYGPTEATVATSLVDVTADVLARYPDMPVGAPMRGSRLLTETADGKEATKEAPGEILIIGDHVSTGYLGNDALNAQKFFTADGKRGFRTGDYGWFEDGLLFFNGRQDEQVKLNGFRIELGDITAQLLSVPGVADAIAVPLTAGGAVKRIIGFVRPMPGAATEQELRLRIDERLRKELPDYMVPGDISFVDPFPVSSSHKTDRKALIAGYLAKLG